VKTTWLAYIPSPPRGVWHLGPLPIRAYALFIIIGIVAALLIGDRRWAARGGERGVIYDIAMWAVPFGLLGGRLYHLATDWRTYWGPGGAGFGAALRIWDGGLGIWGAVALGGVGAWIGCRRRGIPLPAFGDAIAPGLILAQAIGRLGNYFNQELYGRETTLPWGLEIFYRRDPSGFVDPHSLDGVSTGQVAFVVQPTFLYELVWDVLVFVALIYVDRRFQLGHGRLFATYVAGYCVGRFCVELLRDDAATQIAGIRINSFTSTFVFIGAVVYIILAPKGREDPESLRGVEDVAAEPEPEREPAAQLVAVGSASAATASAPVAGGEGSTEVLEAAEVAEAESVEPETMQAEVAEDEAEPETVKAEAAEAEVVEPEAEEAPVVEPEIEEPEAEGEAEPEVAEAPVVEPEIEELEAEGEAEPEVAEAPAVEPEIEEPEAEGEPEGAGEEVAESDVEVSEAAEPAPAEELEAEPEAAEAQVAEAEAVEPEAAEPEAEEPAQTEGEVEVDDEQSEPEALKEPAEETVAADEEAKSEEPASEKAAEETPAGDDGKATPSRWSFQTPAGDGQKATPRRWSFRLRNRRGR
jgi:prolipoprotein diacylglyceryl transferase